MIKILNANLFDKIESDRVDSQVSIIELKTEEPENEIETKKKKSSANISEHFKLVFSVVVTSLSIEINFSGFDIHSDTSNHALHYAY